MVSEFSEQANFGFQGTQASGAALAGLRP